MRRIGVLTNLVADDPEAQARVGAFLQGLQESGWTLGRNVRIDYRWGGGDADRTRRYAAKLVARAPVVSLPAGGAVLAPLLQATCTVPVVFAQSPSRQGAYAELSLPAAEAVTRIERAIVRTIEGTIVRTIEGVGAIVGR